MLWHMALMVSSERTGSQALTSQTGRHSEDAEAATRDVVTHLPNSTGLFVVIPVRQWEEENATLEISGHGH
jgi:hypothetical protein